MKIKWITHAAFQISVNGTIIYTDPYQLPDGLPAGDIILVSHEHFDHAEASSIKKVIKKDTIVVCPNTCKGALKQFNPQGMDPGDVKTIGDVTIRGVPACTFPGKKFHPRENKWLGYIIEHGGKKVYHAGDCDIMDDMKELEPMGIDVALLPVGDKGYTMDFNDAAKATGYIKPKIVVPMHDWDQDTTPFIDLVAKEAPGVKVEILKGKDLEI